MPKAAERSDLDDIVFSTRRFDERMLDNMGHCDPRVKAMARQAIQLGGKRLRPRIAFLSARAVGPCDEATLFDAAAAVEYLHTASLIHDDVVDGAAIRRGGAAPHIVWGARDSVLAGDFLLARSLFLLARCSGEAVATIALAAGRMASGQVMDANYPLDEAPSMERCLHIAADKTASLFSAAAEIGAAAAGAAPSLRASFASYGENLGLAFQIVDDILDIEGEAERLGKEPGQDLREGKITLPVFFALTMGTERERRGIHQTLRQKDEGAMKNALEAIRRTGCDPARDAAARYASAAVACLEPVAPGPSRDKLVEIARGAIARNH